VIEKNARKICSRDVKMPKNVLPEGGVKFLPEGSITQGFFFIPEG
jgi:hypothetical protein